MFQDFDREHPIGFCQSTATTVRSNCSLTSREKVIRPAEGKVLALQERRRMIEAELTKPQ